MQTILGGWLSLTCSLCLFSHCRVNALQFMKPSVELRGLLLRTSRGVLCPLYIQTQMFLSGWVLCVGCCFCVFYLMYATKRPLWRIWPFEIGWWCQCFSPAVNLMLLAVQCNDHHLMSQWGHRNVQNRRWPGLDLH